MRVLALYKKIITILLLLNIACCMQRDNIRQRKRYFHINYFRVLNDIVVSDNLAGD